MPQNPKKLLVVEDHPIFRQGLVQLINREADLKVEAEAATVPEAIEVLKTFTPDGALIDISLQGASGLELVKTIREFNSTLPILMLSMHNEEIYAERVLKAGANGFIMKQSPVEDVISALRHVLGGETYLSKKMTSRIINQSMGAKSNNASPSVQKLTDRELEVFQLISQGMSTNEIAKTLGLSVKTVDAHRTHIMAKLNVKNVNELIHTAVQWKYSQAT
ncbi:MAG: response regulator transcription factor [Verrucomicrobiota bacterium]|nr:response regulator transcription factor [Verrucomicrobiota bacterium]